MIWWEEAMGAITRGLILAVVLGAGAFMVDSFYQYIQPTKAFFEYESIEPVSFKAGESPKFASNAAAYRLKPLTSQEELICEYPDGSTEQFGERLITFTPSVIKQAPSLGAVWTLTSTVLPNTPAVCHLEANIFMRVKYGIVKRQYIESERFEIEQ